MARGKVALGDMECWQLVCFVLYTEFVETEGRVLISSHLWEKNHLLVFVHHVLCMYAARAILVGYVWKQGMMRKAREIENESYFYSGETELGENGINDKLAKKAKTNLVKMELSLIKYFNSKKKVGQTLRK